MAAIIESHSVRHCRCWFPDGFILDFTSEAGIFTPGRLYTAPEVLNCDGFETWKGPNLAFKSKLGNMPNTAGLNTSRYGIFASATQMPCSTTLLLPS